MAESSISSTRTLPSGSIRLLDLCPGKWGDKLRGSLRVVSLKTKPMYEALSYTCGPKAQGRTIHIGRDVEIYDNLFVVLRRLRNRGSKRTLWVDALSIEQNNDVEKAEQVAKMGDVYRSATSVIVWLGEYPNSSQLDQFHMRRPHWSSGGKARPTVLNHRGLKFVNAIDSALHATEPKWPDRAWIVQEFVMAQKVWLYFGPVSVPYDVKHIIDVLFITPHPVPHFRAFHERSCDMLRLKHEMSERRMSISETALYTSPGACSMRHDKVYSILSMIDPDEKQMIKIDYRQEVARTFAEATFASIQTQNSFAILELVKVGDRTRTVPKGLPTWAVDFNEILYPTEGRIHRRIPESACLVQSQSTMPTISMTIYQGKTVLTVKGVIFDGVVNALTLPTASPFARGPKVLDFAATQLTPFLQSSFRPNHNADAGSKPINFVGEDDFIFQADVKTSMNEVMRQTCAAWDRWKETYSSPSEQQQTSISGITADCLVTFMEYAAFAGAGCTIFVSSEQFIGWGTATTCTRDCIALIENCKFPMLLREEASSGYSFQGLSYVHGMMKDQTQQHHKSRGLQNREIFIR